MYTALWLRSRSAPAAAHRLHLALEQKACGTAETRRMLGWVHQHCECFGPCHANREAPPGCAVRSRRAGRPRGKQHLPGPTQVVFGGRSSPNTSGLSPAFPYWQSGPAQMHCCARGAQHGCCTKLGQTGRPAAAPAPAAPWVPAVGPPGGAPAGAGPGAGPGLVGGAPGAPAGAPPAAAPPVAPAEAAHLLREANACWVGSGAECEPGLSRAPRSKSQLLQLMGRWASGGARGTHKRRWAADNKFASCVRQLPSARPAAGTCCLRCTHGGKGLGARCGHCRGNGVGGGSGAAAARGARAGSGCNGFKSARRAGLGYTSADLHRSFLLIAC